MGGGHPKKKHRKLYETQQTTTTEDGGFSAAPRPSMEWLERRGHYKTTPPSRWPQKKDGDFFGNDEKPPPSGMIRNVFFLVGNSKLNRNLRFFVGGIPTKTCTVVVVSCDCYQGERSNCWCVGDMLWWRSNHYEGCNEGPCRQSVMKLRSKSTERTNLQIPFPQLDYIRWWFQFQVFFVFTLDPWGNDPSCRIFLKGVGSTLSLRLLRVRNSLRWKNSFFRLAL